MIYIYIVCLCQCVLFPLIRYCNWGNLFCQLSTRCLSHLFLCCLRGVLHFLQISTGCFGEKMPWLPDLGQRSDHESYHASSRLHISINPIWKILKAIQYTPVLNIVPSYHIQRGIEHCLCQSANRNSVINGLKRQPAQYTFSSILVWFHLSSSVYSAIMQLNVQASQERNCIGPCLIQNRMKSFAFWTPKLSPCGAAEVCDITTWMYEVQSSGRWFFQCLTKVEDWRDPKKTPLIYTIRKRLKKTLTKMLQEETNACK